MSKSRLSVSFVLNNPIPMPCMRYLGILLWTGLFVPDGFAQSSFHALDPPPRDLAFQNPWTAINTGLPPTDVWSLLANAGDTLYAGTSAGIFRSTMRGDAWAPLSNSPDSITTGALAITDAGVLFAGTHGGGVYRSVDNGDTWLPVNEGLDNLNVGALGISADGTLFVGTYLGAVYRSTDTGATWEVVFDAGVDNPFVPSFAASSDNTLFSGTDAGVFRSRDGGDTWEAAISGLENLYVESLLLGNDDALFAGTDAGVFRSLDAGEHWMAVNIDSLKSRNVRAMAVNNLNTIFAGTHGGGVFRSLNYGDAWEPVNEGLTTLDVNALLILENGSMFAGTTGGGVFRRDAATDVARATETQLPDAVQLVGNYPNPFSGSTTIRYALPDQRDVRLAVYDATGRNIQTLVQASQRAGWHNLVFDASHLPSGVYFLHMHAESYTATKHFVLLR